MEESAHALSNDDLLRLISFLENPQASVQLAQQSAVRLDPLYSAASQVPFPLSALPPQHGTPMHPGVFPTPYSAYTNPHMMGLLTPGVMQTPVMMAMPQSRAVNLEAQMMAQHQQAGLAQMVHSTAYPAAAEQPSTPSVPESAAPQILGELQQLQLKQREQLEKMRGVQKQLLLMPQKEGLEVVDAQQKQLRLQIEHELKGLQQLHSTVLLEPADIHRLAALQTELRMQMLQCELFRQELQQLVQPHMQKRCIAALFIQEQPFPLVVTKGKPLEEDPVVVQLVTGAALEFSSVSKVKATVTLDITHQGKPPAAQPRFLDSDLQAMDSYRRWHMKFLVGSRKHALTIRFSMIVQVGQGAAAQSATIESEATYPWVVITNECQWEEAEGLLIRKEAFAEAEQVPWIAFANILHRHFLRATRQDLLRPQRSLSVHDVHYLHQKGFGGAPFISAKMYDQFWLWYGKVLQRLRYQRHIGQLWQTGLIHGFLMREEVEALLRNEEVGTFLVRFSERHAGMFAVGYKVEDPDPTKCVRHYLIRPEDLGGTKKALPDFLSEQAAFVSVLQVSVEALQGPIVHRKFAKDPVFEQYYSKRNTISNVNGYDDRVTRGRPAEEDTGDGGGDDDGDGEAEEDQLYMT